MLWSNLKQGMGDDSLKMFEAKGHCPEALSGRSIATEAMVANRSSSWQSGVKCSIWSSPTNRHGHCGEKLKAMCGSKKDVRTVLFCLQCIRVGPGRTLLLINPVAILRFGFFQGKDNSFSKGAARLRLFRKAKAATKTQTSKQAQGKRAYLELPVVRNYRSKLKQHYFLLFGIVFALFQK